MKIIVFSCVTLLVVSCVQNTVQAAYKSELCEVILRSIPPKGCGKQECEAMVGKFKLTFYQGSFLFLEDTSNTYFQKLFGVTTEKNLVDVAKTMKNNSKFEIRYDFDTTETMVGEIIEISNFLDCGGRNGGYLFVTQDEESKKINFKVSSVPAF